jgi:hypothetical protein
MRPAAFLQFRCIGLYPAPNATGIHLNPAFGHQFADVLVRERREEIPTHAQDNHSRVMTPSERMMWVNRHGFLHYQDPSASEVRNEAAGYIYIADTFNSVIRVVEPNGIITRIGGTYSLG